MTTALLILAILLSGGDPSPHDVVKVRTVTEYVNVYVEVPAQVDCQEDEAWTAVDYRSPPPAMEDMHGVTRMCISVVLMIARGIEYAVQQGTITPRLASLVLRVRTHQSCPFGLPHSHNPSSGFFAPHPHEHSTSAISYPLRVARTGT